MLNHTEEGEKQQNWEPELLITFIPIFELHSGKTGAEL